MAIQSIHVGPIENWLNFDDSEFYSDGTTPLGLIIPVAPTTDSGALRKVDLTNGTINPLANLTYVVISASAVIANERVLAVGVSLSLTDGGAGGNVTLNAIQDIRTTAKPEFAGANLTDHTDISADSKALRLGAAQDATLLYDGTDLKVNPKAVGSGRLQIDGGFYAAEAVAYKIVTKTSADSPYTAANEHVIIADTSSGNITINLPALSGVLGRVYHVKKIAAANTVTIDADSAETIDGAATQALSTQYSSLMIIAGSTEWHII